MAIHQTNCEICERIALCEAGTHPGFIAEMETGWAVLGDSQYFRGYCLLLCKFPATELGELHHTFRLRYLEEMALLAEAVRRVVEPHKLNYECLGNLVPHLHWHVFPRRLDEPSPEKPVWLCMPPPNQVGQYALDPDRDRTLIESIRAELVHLTNPAG